MTAPAGRITKVIVERRLRRVWPTNDCAMHKLGGCLSGGRAAVIRADVREEGREGVSTYHLCGACASAIGDLDL